MTQKDILAVKRFNLSQMRSTIRNDLGVQTAKSSGFQFDTPQPLPVYPAAGAGPIIIGSLQVPASMTGKIVYMTVVHIGAAGSFVDGSGVLLWHVFRNGAPIKGFENLYVQIGTISQPSDVGILLLQNDLIQVLVEVPAGKIAPVGNPFARLTGFYDYGGAGTATPRSEGAPGASSSASSTSSTSTSTSSTSTSTGGGGSAPTGGCPLSGAPAILLGDRRKWTVETVPNEDFVYLRTDRGREGYFSLSDIKYTQRGRVRVTHLQLGEKMVTIDGEEVLLLKRLVKIPGATVDKYEYQDNDGHMFFAFGFLSHNNKAAPAY